LIIVVDTVVILGLINTRDEHHEAALAGHDRCKSAGHEIVIPRIAVIEMYGHATRWPRIGSRLRMIETMRSLGWRIVEHTEDDFELAALHWERMARSMAPLDYPDLLVWSVAMRLRGPTAVWTRDQSLVDYVRSGGGDVGVFGDQQ